MNKIIIIFVVLLTFLTACESYPQNYYVAGDYNLTVYSSNVSEGYIVTYFEDGGNISLIDNKGNKLYNWSYEMETNKLSGILILDNYDLILVEYMKSIALIDNKSKVIWKKNISAHHDVKIISDRIFTLTRAKKNVTIEEDNITISDEFLTELDFKGNIISNISFFEILDENINLSYYLTKIKENEDINYDEKNIFHVNSIQFLDKDYNEVFTKGQLLFSARNINIIGLIDLDKKDVVWIFGEDIFDAQHYPVMTSEGNILVFDNGRNIRNHSRILEINPLTKEIVWSYNDLGDKNFYSRIMGSAQELENGNILITESTKGRIFEINKEGKTVWEYQKEAIKNESVNIYRAEKYSFS